MVVPVENTGSFFLCDIYSTKLFKVTLYIFLISPTPINFKSIITVQIEVTFAVSLEYSHCILRALNVLFTFKVQY